ncbi:MAG: hypothetical protein MPN21_04575 [Thermoanaerobaculia bacterium]|nr:hypothetical protein [Thermoanaerobaculia bacterium]
MRKTFLDAAGLAFAVALVFGACAQGNEPEFHPEKEAMRDARSWPATFPGQVELQNFQPFRAVYDRKYTQSSGPGKGQPRQDRVVVSAERIGWDGREGVAIHVLDSAAAEHADTNARTLTMIFALDDLSLLFETGPVPGKAKDYYFGRPENDHVYVSQVMTLEQELKPQKIPTDRAGFGPGAWAMASMDLAVGTKIRLDPYYSPQANPISQTNYGHVIEKRTITDGSNGSHEAWVLETSGWYGPSSPKVLRLLLKDQPPYLLGIETFHHDTGEAKPFLWLRDVHTWSR